MLLLYQSLEEDVNNESIPDEADEPEDEEEKSEEMLDERVVGRELGPVMVGQSHHIFGGAIGKLGAWNQERD